MVNNIPIKDLSSDGFKNFRIKKLKLEGFRSFEKAELIFPDSNILLLIGNNGKGKSSILDSIAYVMKEYTLDPLDFDKLPTILNPNDTTYGYKKTTITADFLINKTETKVSLPVVHKKSDPSLFFDLGRAKFGFPYPILSHYNVNRFSSIKTDEETLFNEILSNNSLEYHDYRFNQFETNFAGFQIWFRLEEDIENRFIRESQNFNLTNPRLDAIRLAVKTFFNYLEGKENMYSGMLAESLGKKSILKINKDGIKFNLEQLSDGEKMLLLLISDIARSLAIYNDPHSDRKDFYIKPLNGSGIVLIDEIDLHLHPKWQRNVIPALTKTFPNIQFIISTHSTSVLSSVDRENIRILDNGKILMPSSNPIGRDSNSILEEIQGVSKRPKEIEELIEIYISFINNNDFKKADTVKKNLINLNQLDREDPIFARGDSMIERKKMLML